MDKQQETKVFGQIDGLLARWRNEITQPARTKPDQAEEGINLYYKSAGKNPPLILWCDSPIQIILIPTLVANVLRSEAWKTLLKKMGGPSKADSEQYLANWKSEWTKIEKSTVLPLLERIWNFQFQSEPSSVKQKVLDRLAEHMFIVLKDGRLTAENVHPKKWKANNQTQIWPPPAHFEMWREFIKLTADIERKTTSEFNFNAANAQGIVFGVFDHRLISSHIPVVKDILAPTEEQKERLKRVEHIRSKCAELETIAATRAASLTEVMNGFTRPTLIPNIDPNSQWYQQIWSTYEETRKDLELRNADPRAQALVVWGVGASWLPRALSCRLLDTDLLKDVEQQIDGWAYMFHGAAGYLLCDDVCFVCRHPKSLVTNDSGQPHCGFGAAITWNDGFDVHAWRGVIVTEEMIKRAPEIRIEEILKEENAETRRILLDMFGQDRFIRESGATKVHEDQFGTLYRYEFTRDEPLQMVRVRNATRELDGTYKDYYLRVPPDVTTGKQAVAWTFGLTPEEYMPEFQS